MPSRSSFFIYLVTTSLCARSWIPIASPQRRTTGLSAAATDDDDTTYFQRTFYRFTPGSDVDIPNAAVMEERCTLRKDPQRPDYVIPVSRSLIVRDGQVEEGDIGDDWMTTAVPTKTSPSVASIATALYLMGNPNLVSCKGGGKMWHLGGPSALSSLLGVLGGAKILGEDAGTTEPENVDENILTISKDQSSGSRGGGKTRFPNDLQLLTVADANESNLQNVLEMAKNAGAPMSQLNVEAFDWRVRSVRPRGSGSAQAAYRTIVGTELDFSYPEAKELARTVANRLEASSAYLTNPDPTIPLPRFVYVCEESPQDEEVPYLRRLLEKGYRMSTATHYLKLEKISFQLQKLSSDQTEEDLEEMELEVRDDAELSFQCLTAQHSPDFAGGGSGELFFPMETGAYDASTGSWQG